MIYGGTRIYAEFSGVLKDLNTAQKSLSIADRLKVEASSLKLYKGFFINKFPNIVSKLQTYDNTTQLRFFDNFLGAEESVLQVIEDNTQVINVWAKSYSLSGQQALGANASIWAKHIEAYSLLQQGKHNEVASLFGKTLSQAFPHGGVNWVVDGVADLDALNNAIAIANRTDDAAIIATKMGIPLEVMNVVKKHYWIEEYLVPLDGTLKVGRFEKTAADVAIWNAAIENGITKDVVYRLPDNLGKQTIPMIDAQNSFKSLIPHEYVESKLMDAGFPFRGLLGNREPNPFSLGADNLSINPNLYPNGVEFPSWGTKMMLEGTPTPFNGDYTKLDMISNQIIQKLKLSK